MWIPIAILVCVLWLLSGRVRSFLGWPVFVVCLLVTLITLYGMVLP